MNFAFNFKEALQKCRLLRQADTKWCHRFYQNND